MTELDGGMKSCPFCAESIQAAAIKCKHCQSVLAPPRAAAVPGTTLQAARPPKRETYWDRYWRRWLPTAWVMAGVTVAAAFARPLAEPTYYMSAEDMLFAILVGPIVGFFFWGSVVSLFVAMWPSPEET